MADDTSEPMSSADDAALDADLAARIRGALDARVSPVQLDEITTATGAMSADGSSAAPGLSTDGAGDDGSAAAALALDPTGRGPQRDRRPLLLAAAVLVVVLLGAGLLIARDRTPSVTTAPAVDPPADPAVAPGGVFDRTATVLDDKRVTAVAAGDNGLLYLAYVDSNGGDPEAAAKVEELENQAEAVGEEADRVQGDLDADPASPGAANRQEEVAGLRSRQAELLEQARVTEASTNPMERFASGLLVTTAADGAVLADHLLPGEVAVDGLAAAGDRAWIVADPSRAPGMNGSIVSLLVVEGAGEPTEVDSFDAPASIAVDAEDLWLRRTEVLERRDPISGAWRAGSSGPWAGPGAVATGDGGTWSTTLDVVVSVDPDGAPGTSVTVALDGSPFDRRLLVAGGSVLVVGRSRTVRLDADGTFAPNGAPTYDEGPGITGSDASNHRFWLVSEDTDPQTALVDVAVVDGATGESRSTQVSIVGTEPIVAALDDASAVVCVEAMRTTDRGDGTPAFGSDCTRVSSPFGSGAAGDAAAPDDPVTTTTSADEDIVEQRRKAAEATTTTTGPGETVPAPTTTVAPRALEPNGITLDGLAPIRLGMTPDELTAATGLATVEIEPLCGRHGREVVGLPEGVYVVFNGDDTVRAVTIRTPAFSTVEGLTVDSSVAELRSAHPDAEVFDQVTAVQYLVVAPDRTSEIAFSTEGDDITVITVVQGDGDFMDLC